LSNVVFALNLRRKRFLWLSGIPSKKDVSKKKTPNGKWFQHSRCGHGKNEIVYA
jgi:hypothetical protein